MSTATTTTSNKASANKLIRKLGIFEHYFHNEIELNGSSINASTILLNSKVNLFENIELFNKAARLWQKTQPFLQSKVVDLNKENGIQPDLFNKYFAYVDQMEDGQETEKLDNVNFYYFKASQHSTEHDDCKDFWKLLVERELSNPIDWKNGPMWRLSVINLNKNKSSDSYYEYCLIITVSHAIFDGTSAFVSLVSLFTILEYLFENQSQQESIRQHLFEAKVVEPVEEYVRTHLEAFNLTYDSLGEYKKLGGFKRPSSFVINHENDRKPYVPIDLSDELNLESGGFFSALDNEPVLSLKDLIRESESSVTKFYTTVFEGEKYEKFLATCKNKNSKVTGVFNTMFVLAWRMVYKKFASQLDRYLVLYLKQKKSKKYPIFLLDPKA
jgi:hypothetical protein